MGTDADFVAGRHQCGWHGDGGNRAGGQVAAGGFAGEGAGSIALGGAADGVRVAGADRRGVDSIRVGGRGAGAGETRRAAELVIVQQCLVIRQRLPDVDTIHDGLHGAKDRPGQVVGLSRAGHAAGGRRNPKRTFNRVEGLDQVEDGRDIGGAVGETNRLDIEGLAVDGEVRGAQRGGVIDMALDRGHGDQQRVADCGGEVPGGVVGDADVAGAAIAGDGTRVDADGVALVPINHARRGDFQEVRGKGDPRVA